MKILLRVLKEIGIAIGIFIILAATVVITFKDQLPYDEEIREGDEYVKANLKDYSVSSSDRISEVEAITITHEANTNQIVEAENDVRIQTGKYTPFGTISNNSDLPTEKVGSTINITGNTNISNNNSSTNQNAENDGELQYPVTENAIRQIEDEQSESSASAAERRFDNVQ